MFPRTSAGLAKFGLISVQSEAAYSFESSRSSGGGANFGSALYRWRSEYASFFASIRKCQ
jgi:hypothetical protein